MIFNSTTYLLFLTVAVILYWSLPRRPRLWMLFIASLIFYGFWRVEKVELHKLYPTSRKLTPGHKLRPATRARMTPSENLLPKLQPKDAG